jgi:hypothetical protein
MGLPHADIFWGWLLMVGGSVLQGDCDFPQVVLCGELLVDSWC